MSGCRRLLGGLGAAAVLLAPGLAHPALADEGDPATGWWSRTRLGTPVEAPDTVPDGGLYVAAGPTGRMGVSALRAELGADLRATSLTLEVAESQGTVAVTVCAAGAPWTPVDGGRIEDAPPEDCTLPAQGVVEEGKLVVLLDPAIPPGPLDVVLLPSEGAVFTLSLQRPTAAAVTVEPVMEDFALPDGTGGDLGGGGGASGSGWEGAELPPLTGSGALPAPSGVSSMPPLLAGELPTLPGSTVPDPLAPTVAAPPAAFAPVPLAGSPLDPRQHTVPAAVLLTLILAFAIRLQAEPVRGPRGLGGAARAGSGDAPSPEDLAAAAALLAAVAPERGVGRFRSPRPELSTAAVVAAAGPQGVGRFRRTRAEPPVRL